VGLLHGRLSAQEKEAMSQAFKRRDYDILVATTVIEVGVDNMRNALGSLSFISFADVLGVGTSSPPVCSCIKDLYP